jgi:hypothetical protein
MRANVFRFALKLGHHPKQPALHIWAISGHRVWPTQLYPKRCLDSPAREL